MGGKQLPYFKPSFSELVWSSEAIDKETEVQKRVRETPKSYKSVIQLEEDPQTFDSQSSALSYPLFCAAME